jgi:hypothetical protein
VEQLDAFHQKMCEAAVSLASCETRLIDIEGRRTNHQIVVSALEDELGNGSFFGWSGLAKLMPFSLHSVVVWMFSDL